MFVSGFFPAGVFEVVEGGCVMRLRHSVVLSIVQLRASISRATIIDWFTTNDSRLIAVRGARVHNLKNIDVDIPRHKCWWSSRSVGIGKVVARLDTIYAEGQRRYVESLSAYARQFLEQMEKPDVDLIDGLSPAISIEQKTTGSQPALDGRHGHRDLTTICESNTP